MKATFDIQFGHIRRTTHRKHHLGSARDEVAAAQVGRSVAGRHRRALLNDSKYGHKVKDNVLDLNLLRSVPYPTTSRPGCDVTPGEPHHAYTDQADPRLHLPRSTHTQGITSKAA